MRDSVIIYESWKQTADLLPEDERLKFYEMILNYAFYGIENEEKTYLKALFINVKVMMDKARNRHDAAKKNGKKGGRPKTSKKPELKPEEKPELKPELNQSDNLYVYVYEYVDVYNNTITFKSKKEYYEKLFADVWSMYPDKSGKVAAAKHYYKYLDEIIKDKQKPEDSRDRIKSHIESVIEVKIAEDNSKKYIPNGSTYFNNRRWLDEFDEKDEALQGKIEDGEVQF